MFEQTFKNIDDALWKEAGCTTELDYTEQTSWLLFLKYLDDLEQDPLFLSYIQHPLIRQIASRYIGENVSIFRAMFMNKPAESGTVLPWHQDIGVGWGIDTNPIITVWMSLDTATVASGS